MKQRYGATPRKQDALRYAANLLGMTTVVYVALLALLRLGASGLLSVLRSGATLAQPGATPPALVAFLQVLIAGLPLFGAVRFLRAMLPVQMRPKLLFTDPKDVRLWLFLPVFLGLGMLANILTSAVRMLLSAATAYTVPEAVQLPEGALALLFYFVSVCVIPAVGEELLCRGLMQGMLRQWGVWFSIVVSSVAFALLHGDVAQMPSAFLLSVCLGLTAYATNSLMPSMVLHFCNNAMAFLFLLAQQKVQGVAALGASVYLMLLFGLGALVCAVVIVRLRLPATLRPVPPFYNAQNRQSRTMRLAASPLYVMAMLWLTAMAVWPLFGKG